MKPWESRFRCWSEPHFHNPTNHHTRKCIKIFWYPAAFVMYVSQSFSCISMSFLDCLSHSQSELYFHASNCVFVCLCSKMCLRNRHGEDCTAAAVSGCWLCPQCRGSCGEGCVSCCNCGPYRKKVRHVAYPSIQCPAELLQFARSAYRCLECSYMQEMLCW
jgi:hypothetical protein